MGVRSLSGFSARKPEPQSASSTECGFISSVFGSLLALPTSIRPPISSGKMDWLRIQQSKQKHGIRFATAGFSLSLCKLWPQKWSMSAQSTQSKGTSGSLPTFAGSRLVFVGNVHLCRQSLRQMWVMVLIDLNFLSFLKGRHQIVNQLRQSPFEIEQQFKTKDGQNKKLKLLVNPFWPFLELLVHLAHLFSFPKSQTNRKRP